MTRHNASHFTAIARTEYDTATGEVAYAEQVGDPGDGDGPDGLYSWDDVRAEATRNGGEIIDADRYAAVVVASVNGKRVVVTASTADLDA